MKHTKSEVLEKLEVLKEDCLAFIERDVDEFDDPWDVHDESNWSAMLDNLEDIESYIRGLTTPDD